MAWRKGIFALVSALLAAPSAVCAPGFQVEIDLQQQMAYLIHGRRLVLSSPISSGRSGFNTKTGSFKIIQKEMNHYSNLYGKIVDARGRTIVADADADMRVPSGGRFMPAPMRYFMRYNGAEGMHAGYLPGYPASHGCVRMPEELAIAFFNAVEVGTPVHVFGRTPRQNEYFRFGPQPARPRYQPRYQPRFDPRYFDPRMNPRFPPRSREPIYDPRSVPPDDWTDE